MFVEWTAMAMGSTLTGLLLGLLLGVRHAIEPDHLAAVSVLSTDRPGAKRGAMLGALWGVGHSLALLVVVVALTLAQGRMPDRLADAFELAVAAMLVILGALAIRRSFREGARGPEVLHEHATQRHTHPTSAQHVHVGRVALSVRPLVVGLVHGLAGSGALTALVVAGIPSLSQRLAYVVVFGAGSVIGMTALSGIAGWPLAHLSRNPAARRAVTAMTGAFSACLGLVWGWPLAGRLLG